MRTASLKANPSDIGTQNVAGDVFDRVRPELMIERPKNVQNDEARSNHGNIVALNSGRVLE